MEVSQSIQTAALAGMGLLYLGSGNRSATVFAVLQAEYQVPWEYWGRA